MAQQSPPPGQGQGQQQHQSYAVIARRYIDAKAKPPGSLGLLEGWAVKLAALQVGV